MTTALAWIDGRWGPPEQLALPLNDRGLQLAEGLFETVLLRRGVPVLLDQHLQRWRNGADVLGLAPPPDHQQLMPLISEAVQRAQLAPGDGVLRLNWSRGSAGRGIDPAASGNERFWLSLQPIQPLFSAVSAVISQLERRNATSALSRCKSFAYGQSLLARREARRRGADDALLLNTAGQLCCGTAANLLVRREGRWLTPGLSGGCLPGVMRSRCLATGLAQVGELGAMLRGGDQALLINSLSCRPIHRLDGVDLSPIGEASAEKLWEQLLE